MLLSRNQEIFLTLVRLGIGTKTSGRIAYPSDNESIDWDAIEALAAQQGLSAVIVDGVERLSEELRPPKPVLLQWIGETLQSFEYRYEAYQKAIAEIAAFYNQHGFKMMIVKGLACSIDWPKPEHRPCGDIDIWQFGKCHEADAALTAWFRVQDCPSDEPAHARNNSSKLGPLLAQSQPSSFKIDTSHHHHTVFYWRDFMVENHYDFINVHHHKSNGEFEQILKELAQDDSRFVELYGEKVYLPSANLHALFLLKHTMMHFAAEGITLRQLLDWAFFVKAHGTEVDWPWLEGVLDRFGMWQLYEIFNAICVEDLGFPVSMFQRVQFEPALKERVLKEILNPEFSEELPKSVFWRVAFKIRRWRGNAWKHKLCYKESMWSAFWSGVWNHLLKPSSI